jgi:hypothetical protein
MDSMIATMITILFVLGLIGIIGVVFTKILGSTEEDWEMDGDQRARIRHERGL